jgi:hypothetical protein
MLTRRVCRVLNHLDFLCRVVLPGEATAGSISVIEQRARLGCMTPRHVHAREAETFIVVDGALEAAALQAGQKSSGRQWSNTTVVAPVQAPSGLPSCSRGRGTDRLVGVNLLTGDRFDRARHRP